MEGKKAIKGLIVCVVCVEASSLLSADLCLQLWSHLPDREVNKEGECLCTFIKGTWGIGGSSSPWPCSVYATHATALMKNQSDGWRQLQTFFFLPTNLFIKKSIFFCLNNKYSPCMKEDPFFSPVENTVIEADVLLPCIRSWDWLLYVYLQPIIEQRKTLYKISVINN